MKCWAFTTCPKLCCLSILHLILPRTTADQIYNALTTTVCHHGVTTMEFTRTSTLPRADHEEIIRNFCMIVRQLCRCNKIQVVYFPISLVTKCYVSESSLVLPDTPSFEVMVDVASLPHRPELDACSVRQACSGHDHDQSVPCNIRRIFGRFPRSWPLTLYSVYPQRRTAPRVRIP